MRSLALIALLGLTAVPALVLAQDPVKVDPNHFKVEINNSRVRVIRYTLAPHETTAVHEHLRPHVEVQLTDSTEKTSVVGGKETTVQHKAGQVDWEGVVHKHTNENVGDTPIETIVIELKGK